MHQFKRTLTAAAAAGLTALAVTAAVPAAGKDRAADDPAAVERTVDQTSTCLRDHGAPQAPGDEGEGRALKEWIGRHQDDAAARDALQACDLVLEQKDGARIEKRTCGDAGDDAAAPEPVGPGDRRATAAKRVSRR